MNQKIRQEDITKKPVVYAIPDMDTVTVRRDVEYRVTGGKALTMNVPLFIVRSGQDEMPRLNETMDRFLAKALTRNLPLTLANHREGPHAFDVLLDIEASRGIIRQILTFMRFHLWG